MPTMTAQEVYSIISQWTEVPLNRVWQTWKDLYNFLPPPPPEAESLWQMAGEIAAAYTGPPIS